MIIPRVGALILLVGFGYGLVTYAKLAFVTGVEGYWSWATSLAFLLPAGALGIAAAVLVLRRHPLGRRLALPFGVLAVISGLLAIGGAPPIGQFLRDYEQARIERGITVPPYEASQGMTSLEYAEKVAGDLRLQGALVGIASAVAFVVLTRRGGPPRSRAAQTGARAAS
jgi:hypothetical protein